MRLAFFQLRRSDLLRIMTMGLLWAVLGVAITQLLDQGLHVPPFWTDVLENLVVGFAVAFVFWSYENYRRQVSRRWAATVSELNHHIRNALQMITYSRYAPEEQQLHIVEEATIRIDAVLKEITEHRESGL